LAQCIVIVIVIGRSWRRVTKQLSTQRVGHVAHRSLVADRFDIKLKPA
jgi:hypothetical protein